MTAHDSGLSQATPMPESLPDALPEGWCDDIETMALFDLAPTPLPEPAPALSADRRRTIRQAADITAGRHPPHSASPVAVYRHPATKGLAYSRDDERGRDLTCGSCHFRVIERAGNGSFLKRHADEGRRVTGGPGTDIRSYWPACSKWVSR